MERIISVIRCPQNYSRGRSKNKQKIVSKSTNSNICSRDIQKNRYSDLLCWYHKKLSEKAKKCIKLCSSSDILAKFVVDSS